MKNIFFQNTLKALNFRFVLPNGKTLTEYIKIKPGLLTTVGNSETAQIQIPGNLIAPEHFVINYDRHNAYIEVLTTGFPIAINGQMFGSGQKTTVGEKTNIRIGEVNAYLWMEHKKDGFVKRTILAFGGGILIGLLLISLISTLFIQINRYNLLLESAVTNPSFQKRIEIFSDAATILSHYPILKFLVNENKYQEQITRVLTEQYFLTPTIKADERNAILNHAKSLGVAVPELNKLYDTEIWAKNTVIKWDVFFNKGKDTTYTLPDFESDVKELNAKPALKYCKEMVEVIDQSQKLKINRQIESAIQLLFESAILKDGNKYTKFFRSLLLYRISCLLVEYGKLKHHNEALLLKFRENYENLDPKFEFVSNGYFKSPKKHSYSTVKKTKKNKDIGFNDESRITPTKPNKIKALEAKYKAYFNKQATRPELYAH